MFVVCVRGVNPIRQSSQVQPNSNYIVHLVFVVCVRGVNIFSEPKLTQFGFRFIG